LPLGMTQKQFRCHRWWTNWLPPKLIDIKMSCSATYLKIEWLKTNQRVQGPQSKTSTAKTKSHMPQLARHQKIQVFCTTKSLAQFKTDQSAAIQAPRLIFTSCTKATLCKTNMICNRIWRPQNASESRAKSESRCSGIVAIVHCVFIFLNLLLCFFASLCSMVWFEVNWNHW
jgi:hypothetical protein